MTRFRASLILMMLTLAANIQSATISAFDPGYIELLQVAESDPQRALDKINEIDTSDFTAERKAEHFYFKSIFYGFLDYPNKILENAEAGLRLIDKKRQPWLHHHLTLEKVSAWIRLGIGLKGFSDTEAALSWAKQNNELQLQLNSLHILSSLYIQIEDYTQALSLVQEGYKLAPEDGIEFVKADFSSQMSAIYIYRDEFEIALPYLEEQYQFEKRKNNQLGMSIALYELGRAHLILNNAKQGIQLLEESIEISEQISDKQGIAYANNELAAYYIEQEQFAKAESLLLDSIKYFQQSNNTYLLFDTYLQLSKLYIQIKDVKLATEYLEKARPLINPVENPYGTLSVKRMSAKILAADNQHQKAFDILLTSIEEQRELEANQSAEKLHAIRTLYEIEASNKENELLSNQNQLQEQELDKEKQQNILLLILLISVLLVMSLFIYFMLKFKKQTRKLHYVANYDELTGLRNRNNTMTTIRDTLSNLSNKQQLFLIMLDLDHFKSINDQYGHALGDKVLRLFGEYCQQAIESLTNAIVGRVGGEEFMICIVNDEKTEVYNKIEALRIKTQNMPQFIKAPGLKVSFSAGICAADETRNSFRDLHKCADAAMYQAKHEGRNRIIFSQ